MVLLKASEAPPKVHLLWHLRGELKTGIHENWYSWTIGCCQCDNGGDDSEIVLTVPFVRYKFCFP